MSTDWTPFPECTDAPLLAAALNDLKSRYTDGIDYYRETYPYMSHALIADFESIYDEYIDRFITDYNKLAPVDAKISEETHFKMPSFPRDTDRDILRICKAEYKMRKLVEFERDTYQPLIVKQKEAWSKLSAEKPWPEPNSPELLTFACARIQKLEAIVERLSKENEALYRVLTETRI
jgi:hypothetical protein